jgi:8-oxo-dGTP pyrophosphatase MutT (NUDIX family)
MYKVFIENRPIIFAQNDALLTNTYCIASELLEKGEEDLALIVKRVPKKKNIVVLSDQIEDEFARIFKEYDFIEAAGGIVKRKKKYLFIKRNGFWDIPKGKLENKEAIEEGAIREIEEECGIIGPVIENRIGITYHTYRYEGKATIKKTYWFALTYDGPKELTGQLEEGITKVEWLKLDELKKVVKNTFPSILEVIQLYFEQNKSSK